MVGPPNDADDSGDPERDRAEDLGRARRIARAMRDGVSTIGPAGERVFHGEKVSLPFHRPGSPYGALSFDEGDCEEAGRLFLKLLGDEA